MSFNAQIITVHPHFRRNDIFMLNFCVVCHYLFIFGFFLLENAQINFPKIGKFREVARVHEGCGKFPNVSRIHKVDNGKFPKVARVPGRSGASAK